MTCSIQIDEVKGANPDGGGTPETITVRGIISSSCLQILAKLQLPGALSQIAPVTNGQFEATLQRDVHYAAGDVVCGNNANVTLTVDCLDGDSCHAEQRLDSLDCETAVPPCDLAFAAVDPVTAVSDPDAPVKPVTITITGTTQTCAGVEVRFLYQINNNPQQTPWLPAALANGVWTLTFQRNIDYIKELGCGDLIQVEVRCPDNTECRIGEEFTIDCDGGQECPAATLAAMVTNNCQQGRREVIFTVILADVNDQTDISGSIKTGDFTAVTEIELPVEYSADTADTWQSQGNSIFTKDFSHYYLEGAYTATLNLVGDCAETVPLTRITDADGDPLTSLAVPACNCPDVKVSRTVCRVVKEGLTCADEIPDDTCAAVSEAELDAGLEPGLYIVTATTDPPDAAISYSWSINSDLQEGENSDRLCVVLEEEESLDVTTAVAITQNCIPTTGVTLQSPPADDDGGDDDGTGDDTDDGDDTDTDDNDDDDTDTGGENGDGDGCFPNLCLIWLWATFGVALLAGVAIVVTACILFNPVTLTNAFWVGVVISVILVIVTIISLILWAIFCSRLPNMCGPLVWVHDILLMLAAATGIFGLILMFFGQLPCGIGFILDFAYFGLLATITEITIRVIGCPLGQNGIVGLVLGFINWITGLLGLGDGNEA